jgi:hypothetical protein
MIKTKSITVAADAPDDLGKFQATIHANDPQGDRDRERIEEFKNTPGVIGLKLEHRGSAIGTASILPKEDGTLIVLGQLYMNRKDAQDVRRRMLLPPTNPKSLTGMSVGFGYDPSTVRDHDGIRTIPSAELREVSLCHRLDARQRTEMVAVKSRTSTDALGWRVAAALVDAGVTVDDPDFRAKALAMIKKLRPATRVKAKSSPKRDKRFVVSTTHPKYGVFDPQVKYLSELADGVAKIARDMGYPDLGEELRDIVMVDGIDDPKSTERHLASAVMDRARRAARCPRCRRMQDLELQDPPKGCTVVWAQTPCCQALLGWSTLPKEQYVREMKMVRTYVDTGLSKTDRDLVAQLERAAGAKHLPRTAEAAFNAVRDAITVADGARARIGHLVSLQRQLEENILRRLRLAAESLAADARDVPKAATWALQAAESMRLVAEIIRTAGYGDVATDLENAADKVTGACDALAPHQLTPPPAPEITGPKSIPAFDAKFRELDTDPAPVPVTGDDDTVTVQQGETDPDHWTIEKE